MAAALVRAAQAPQPGCSVAALAAAMLQQLEQSGLLSSVHVSLLPLMQTLGQQLSSTSGERTPYISLFSNVRAVIFVIDMCFCHARALVPAAMQHTALQATMLLLQQLHGCSLLLPAATAGTGAAGSSSSSSSSGRSSFAYSAYISAQSFATELAYRLHGFLLEGQLLPDVAEQVEQLLRDEAVQECVLQPLVAFVALLHHYHQQQQQQQLQRRAGAVLQHVQPIPAYHQDVLLPGGQAYHDAAAAALPVDLSRHQDSEVLRTWTRAAIAAAVLDGGLRLLASRVPHGQQQLACNPVMLSAAAVRLVLELQLLAAVEVQQQQQQQQQQGAG
uniref:Uncharacterized protein n=1 Tax=Tetradesmus obliquus TaxID=3088 RepID=A0A383VTJ6_TETOB|eukprot:jgi/Sobl393_1/7688/SZX68511.1